MGVMFFGPRFFAPSHVWMRRMADYLGEDLKVIVDFSEEKNARHAGCEWLKIDKPRGNLGTFDNIFAKWWCKKNNSKKIRNVLARDDVTVVLINFLNYAVDYRKVISCTNKLVFVHCHGLDVTPQLRRSKRGLTGWRVHSVFYSRRVRNLPKNVRFIANSLSTKAALLRMGVPQSKIYLKYFGVPNKSFFYPKGSDTSKNLNILYLGRLVDFKGPDLTIKAFAVAHRLGLRAQLTMAGDGPKRKECEVLCEELGIKPFVKFVGPVSEQEGDELRRTADVFTAHNQRGPESMQEEAFGVAFVEAMAAGLPIVTGRSGGIPEIVEDGCHGLLFESGDVEAHAHALLRLQNDYELRKRLGRNARDRAITEFTIEKERKRLRTILGLPTCDSKEIVK